MKNWWLLGMVVGSTVMLSCWAETPKEMSGDKKEVHWGVDSHYQETFNLDNVETISGKVMALQSFSPGLGGDEGMQFTLKAAREEIVVQLAPNWFLEHQDDSLKEGDAVEVTGSRVTADGKSHLMAQEVRRGSSVLTLRDEDGLPLWSAWRKDEW